MQHLLRVTGANQCAVRGFLLLIAPFAAQAQCPIANTCSLDREARQVAT
jgi:hypothetical protein